MRPLRQPLQLRSRGHSLQHMRQGAGIGNYRDTAMGVLVAVVLATLPCFPFQVHPVSETSPWTVTKSPEAKGAVEEEAGDWEGTHCTPRWPGTLGPTTACGPDSGWQHGSTGVGFATMPGCNGSRRRSVHILEEATSRPAVFPQKLLVGASWRHRKPQEAFSKVLGAHQSLIFGFGALQGPKRKGAGSPEWQRTH